MVRAERTVSLRLKPELLGWLQTRYGLYVNQLPHSDGFGSTSITERQAFQENRRVLYLPPAGSGLLS